MTLHNRHLLAIALGTAMIASPAFAQDDTDPTPPAVDASAAVAGDAQATDPALPPQTNPLVEEDQPIDPRLPVAGQADDSWDLAPPLPDAARGAMQADDRSGVVQRSVWDELDADADGRVSAEEGAIDADFADRFEAFDSDGDGFVTDAEYRAGANAAQRDGADEEAGSNDDIDGASGEGDPVDPLDDRDGMDDDGTGMDEQDGGEG